MSLLNSVSSLIVFISRVVRPASKLIILILSVLLVGCGLSSSSPPAPEIATAIIGTAGGTISTPAGKVSIVIPAGALDADQEITISLEDASTIENPLSTTNDMLTSSDVRVELLPDGLTFATPITITVDIPGASTPVAEGNFNGFSVALLMAALTSADGTPETLTNPTINVDPATGEVSLSAQFSHFSDVLIWDEFKLGGIPPVKVEIFGYQDTLAVNSNIVIAAKPSYEPGIFDQLHLNLTDQSSGAFNRTGGGSGTFSPLLDKISHNIPYTCSTVGPGIFKADIVLDIISTNTAPDPSGGPNPVQGISFNGKDRAIKYMQTKFNISKPVNCVAEIVGGGNQGGGNQNAGSPKSTAIEEFTATLSASTVEVGQTFTVTTKETINGLLLSSVFADSRLQLFSRNAVPEFSNVGVTSTLGGGVALSTSSIFVDNVTQTRLSQEFTLECRQVGTHEVDIDATFSMKKKISPFDIVNIQDKSPTTEPLTVTCVAPPTPVVEFGDTNLAIVIEEDEGIFNFTVTSNSPAPQLLNIPFNVTGTATTITSALPNDSDANFFAADFIIIDKGSSSGSVPIHINDDALNEGPETIILEIKSSSNPVSGNYVLGTNTVFTLEIQDNDNSSGVTSHWSSETSDQFIGTSTNLNLEVDAGAMNGAPSDVTVTTTNQAVLIFESLFANLRILPANLAFKSSSLSDDTGTKSVANIGTPITNGIHFDNTPTVPYVVTAVPSCLTEGVSTLTANITDNSGAVLSTSSIDVTCSPPPASAACLDATTGLEKAYECNNGLVGTLPIADFFVTTVIDVPIGGGAGRTVPGGITLHLPSTLSGAVPVEADFPANGWDGSLGNSAPVSSMFGLDATHEYLFIQYESGVDLIDLSTPSAEPVFTGLLDYPGRVQAAEFNNLDDFSKLHDYFVMPVHSASGDYLIGCGTDVVRHDYDSAANSGAGAFVANATRISDGFELCRDIWTDTNVNGVAPGYAYTTKTPSKFSKTTKWLEDGFAEVTLGVDWTAAGVDINNRIMGGAGGFFGEHTLLGSRGISEMGLWSGPTGDAPEGSVTPRISTAAFFQDIRCVSSLCIATASDTISTLLWPDRNMKPTVQTTASTSLGLTARNMVIADNGNIYLLEVISKRIVIGRLTPQGDFGGTLQVDVSSVCTDPQSVQILDMGHLGILCRTDNQFKALEFVSSP